MKGIPWSRVRLTKEEKQIEKEADTYVRASKKEIAEMAAALRRRRKEAILHIRINQGDLDSLKRKAKKLGVKYQTFVSELLHRFAA